MVQRAALGWRLGGRAQIGIEGTSGRPSATAGGGHSATKRLEDHDGAMRRIPPDKLGDWRIEAVTETAGENRSPSGEPIPPGTTIQKISVLADEKHGVLVFPTPSPAALVLSASIDHAIEARRLRREVRFDAPQLPNGMSVNDSDIGALFDFFAHSMQSVMLSFTTLELFANRIIDLHAPDKVKLHRTANGKRKLVELNKEQMERRLGTEEKYTELLRLLLGHGLEAGSDSLIAFRKLKTLRDDIVHFKLAGHYVRNALDRQTVYYRLLNGQALDYPRWALQVLEAVLGEKRDRWMVAAATSLASAARAG